MRPQQGGNMRVLSTIANLFIRGPTEVATDVVQNVASKKMGVVFDRVTGSVYETTKPFLRDSITKSNSNLFKELADEMRKEVKSSVRGKKIDPSEGYKLQKSLKENQKESTAESAKKTRDRTEVFKIHSMRPKKYLFSARTVKAHTVVNRSFFSRPSLFDASRHPQHSNRSIVTREGRTGHWLVR